MTTAQTIINDAADLAGVVGVGASIEGGDNAKYLRALNRMIAGFKNDGVDLGLSSLAAGDTVYVDDSDEEALVYQLATRIFEIVKRPVSPAIYQKAQLAYEDLQAKYLEICEMEIPDSLKSYHYYDINNG